MDPKVAAEKFLDNLLSDEARDQPLDTGNPDEILLELPKWFDEEKFNRGRRFYWKNCFGLSTSTLYGLIAVFAVPSILNVLKGSRRSSSTFTAYKRYLATFLHISSWSEYELKPGSISWKSLTAVRTRHLKATKASKLKGGGIVSQRDVAITQFALFGYSILKPHAFGICQREQGEWEAFNHFWRVIGYFIGLEDRYNICRETFEETLEVGRVLMERVYTPCLNNPPEYFEHMTRVMLEGMMSVNTLIDIDAFIYWVKYLSDVPGYVYTETDRIETQYKIKKQLAGKSLDEGVDAADLIQQTQIEGLPKQKRLLYYKDYECLETVPSYKPLDWLSRFRLGFLYTVGNLSNLYLCRLYLNFNYLCNLYIMKYLPYLAMWKFGIKEAYVSLFVEAPVDDTQPKTNDEYYNEKKTPRKWHKLFF